QPNIRVNRASGPRTSSSDSLSTRVQVGAAKTSSSTTGDDDDTNGRLAESMAATTTDGVSSGAASTMGSDRDTSSVGEERNSTQPESSCTRILVLGEGRLEASAPQRNSGLTS